MVKNVPSLQRDIKSTDSLSWEKKKSTGHIIIKILKTKGKEKNLDSSLKKPLPCYRRKTF